MRFNSLLTGVVLFILLGCEGGDSSSEFNSTGQGGSMTRFAIHGNYMYVVDNTSIKVFNIAGAKFQQIKEVTVGFGMETIFAKGDYLYLGANDAMYIYSVAEADNPTFIFRYAHIVSCDPVVVQGNRAYVTMRGGTWCNQGSNALEIIDISNPYEPRLVRNYPMSSPHGLGIDNNILFVCEGEHGVKVFDVTNENDIKQISHLDYFFAYDVILREGIATITGEDGIFQYAYNSDGIEGLVSKIPVNRAEL